MTSLIPRKQHQLRYLRGLVREDPTEESSTPPPQSFLLFPNLAAALLAL